MSEKPSSAGGNGWDIGFGIAVILLSGIALLVWFPADIGSGFLEKSLSGLMQPGDAFFPDILAGTMLVLGFLQCLIALNRSRTARPGRLGRVSAANLAFAAASMAGLALVLAVMTFLGPAVVALMRDAGLIDKSYRALIDTAPYKYIGFAAGGFLLVFLTSSLLEARWSRRGFYTAILLVLILILVFDILLTNVFLPPNLDV